MAEATPATAPYEVHRKCMCMKPIPQACKWKCKRCKWNFCSQACQILFAKEHRVNCGPNKALNNFFKANARFFAVYGFWLRLQPEHNYLGMRIDVQSAERVRVTPIEKQSVDILLQEVKGTPQMYKSGYPDYFLCLIAWQGAMVCFEIDLVCGGSIVGGDSPEFDVKDNEKFITTPAEAAAGTMRDGWMKTFRPRRIHRDWDNFAVWQALNSKE